MTDTSSSAEAELALNTLLDKHQRWLMQQPELLLLWPLGRQTRKQVARLLAAELLTIPVRESNENTPPNRAMRREMMKVLERTSPTWWEGI